MQYLFMILLPFIAALVILPSIWRKYIDGKVHIAANFEVNIANIGEAVPVEIIIVNQSWLPCPMIHGVLKLSKGLSSRQNDGEFLAFTVFLWMKQEVRLRQLVYGWARGPKQIVSVTLEMNEGLGLRRLTLTENINASLFVLPELLDYKKLQVITKEISGNVEINRWFLFDESKFKGIRPYQNRDPMKSIHWRATARTGNLMSKQFNGSTEGKIVYVLNAQFVEPFWAGASSERFDELCSVVATSACIFEQKGIRLSLFANGTMVNHPRKQGYGTLSAKGIRKTLSMMLPYVNGPFERLLETVRIETGSKDMLIIVTSFLTAKQKWMLQELRSRGRQLILLMSEQVDGERLWDRL